MSSNIKTLKNGILVSLVLLSSQSWAAPSVTSMSGTVQEGNTITLYGSSFGSFGGEIVSWDDFDDHPEDSYIHNSAAKIGENWTTQYSYSGSGARFDSLHRHSGARAAHLDWSADTNSIRAFGWANRGPYNRLYISYWRYMTGAYSTSSGYNHKQFYLFGTSGDFPQLMPLLPAGTSTWGIYNNISDSSVSYSQRNNINTLGWSYDNTKDRFQRWDVWTVLNDVNVANGVVRAWLDGRLGINNNSYNTRRVDGEFDDFRLGHMAQGFMDSAKAWYDDLYIATTQARVELCDAPTWATCFNREIQVVNPQQWASGQLTFQIRRGGLDSLSGKYLYVVDQNGDANANGLPIMADGETAPPMAPGNLSIQAQ